MNTPITTIPVLLSGEPLGSSFHEINEAIEDRNKNKIVKPRTISNF